MNKNFSSKPGRDRSPAQPQKRGISTKSSQLGKAIQGLKRHPEQTARDLRQGLQQAASSHDEKKYITAVAAFGWACDLDDEDAFAEFAADKFWLGHNKLRHENRLRYCLIYVYGSHKNVKLVGQARDHARALQDYFDGLYTPDEVLAALRKGGLSKAKQATKPQPKTDDGWMRGSFQARGDVAARLDHFSDGQAFIFGGTIELRKGRPMITVNRLRIDQSETAPSGSILQNRGPSPRNANSQYAPLRPGPAPDRHEVRARVGAEHASIVPRLRGR